MKNKGILYKLFYIILENFEQKNLTKYSSFITLKKLINFYEEFLKHYDLIKSILFENNNEKVNINIKNYLYNEQILKSDFTNIKKTNIDSMYIRFTINSFNEYSKF